MSTTFKVSREDRKVRVMFGNITLEMDPVDAAVLGKLLTRHAHGLAPHLEGVTEQRLLTSVRREIIS